MLKPWPASIAPVRLISSCVHECPNPAHLASPDGTRLPVWATQAGGTSFACATDAPDGWREGLVAHAESEPMRSVQIRVLHDTAFMPPS